MYLVHARFCPHAGAAWPADAAELVRAHGTGAAGLEHVVVHPDAPGGPVVGLFLVAPGLSAAESEAAAVIRRALDRCPTLAGFTLVSCQVVLIPDFGSGIWF